MTRTAAETRGETSVLIAGGGVAALEAALALRALADALVHVELSAPELHFFYRPLAVAELFGAGRVHRWELDDLARAAGADFVPGALAAVDAGAHVAEFENGASVGYDALVLATGARPQEAVPGALTFRGPADVEAVERLLAEIARGEVGRVVFAVPSGVVWPLPLYELALLTAAELQARGADARPAIVTAEPRPLALFGETASEAVEAMLLGRDIELRTSTYPQDASGGVLACEGGEAVEADRVVALPRLAGPGLEGVPRDVHGFVPTDDHGRVVGLEDVYAAGDLTTFPIKQGGLAAQQADAAAETIAAAAGAAVIPKPFAPVLRALLLTGKAPTFLRVELGEGQRDASTATDEPLWWPPGKIVGRYLSPFLAELGLLDVTAEPDDDVLRVELDATAAHTLGWPR
jgi:sulfide:quinone oxidoreductase